MATFRLDSTSGAILLPLLHFGGFLYTHPYDPELMYSDFCSDSLSCLVNCRLLEATLPVLTVLRGVYGNIEATLPGLPVLSVLLALLVVCVMRGGDRDARDARDARGGDRGDRDARLADDILFLIVFLIDFTGPAGAVNTFLVLVEFIIQQEHI